MESVASSRLLTVLMVVFVVLVTVSTALGTAGLVMTSDQTGSLCGQVKELRFDVAGVLSDARDRELVQSEGFVERRAREQGRREAQRFYGRSINRLREVRCP